MPKIVFEPVDDAAGEYRWRVRHENGNILADSGEGYTRKDDRMESVVRLIALIKTTPYSELLRLFEN